MAMHFSGDLTPTQLDAAREIYSGFYSYAVGQGADATAATEFANMGVGVSSGEGLLKANPWSANADAGVTSLGPFQLNIVNGVGADFGLNENSPPSVQIQAAASTMWNGDGTAGYYNTQPWNAVGDTPGSGGNDTFAGQTTAINIGSQYQGAYNLAQGGGAATVDYTAGGFPTGNQPYGWIGNIGSNPNMNPGGFGDQSPDMPAIGAHEIGAPIEQSNIPNPWGQSSSTYPEGSVIGPAQPGTGYGVDPTLPPQSGMYPQGSIIGPSAGVDPTQPASPGNPGISGTVYSGDAAAQNPQLSDGFSSSSPPTTSDAAAPFGGDSGPMSFGLAGGAPDAIGSGSISSNSLGMFGNIQGITGIAGSIPGPAGQVAGQLSGILGQGQTISGGGGSADSGGGGGAPVNITDAPKVGTAAADTISKATTKSAEALSKEIGQASSGLVTGAAADTSSVTGTATGLTQYFGNLSYDMLPRVVSGLGALVLIGAGLWMIGNK